MSSAATPAADKPRFILIGGFLGAGKTTAVSQLAAHLQAQGRRVGVITNDQGRDLVDTAVLRWQGMATVEIDGGCFCCRFVSLVDAVDRLTAQGQPEFFVAEPVGSCTDLAATVTFPLRQLYGDRFEVAPFSVLVDPVRALRALGLEPGAAFSDDVRYIYFKQLEEADLVVIAKADTVDAGRLAQLEAAIRQLHPTKAVLRVSCRTGEGVDEWFRHLKSQRQEANVAMQVDYSTYARGEAQLGWLNATVQLEATAEFDPDALLARTAAEIQARLRARQAEIAHLKMSLEPEDEDRGVLPGINLVRTDADPEMRETLGAPIARGRLLVNLRAEADPEHLGRAVRETLEHVTAAFPQVRATAAQLDYFRPGKPVPEHRLASVAR